MGEAMTAPTLTVRASQRRLLNRVLEVRCPDAMHHWAGRDVPCYPPSEEWPWGWVCIARIERDADTRAARDRYIAALAKQERMRERFERRKAREQAAGAEQRASVAARIAAATRTTTEEES